MRRLRLGLIGHGAIGQAIISHLRAQGTASDIVAVLVREGRKCTDVPCFESIDAFLDAGPEVVIEAASHSAVSDYGPSVVKRGCQFIVSSAGALANKATADALISAATAGGKTTIAAGAIAGLDGLIAAREAGLEQVTYTSLKPPASWRNTAAEKVIDLDDSEEDHVFFDGTAGEAAEAYPKNANVSASIAIAGLGFDRTRVRLVSSRRVSEPLGVIEAAGDFGWFRFEIFANAFPQNRKTSMLTAYSLLQSARLGIGIPLYCGVQ